MSILRTAPNGPGSPGFLPLEMLFLEASPSQQPHPRGHVRAVTVACRTHCPCLRQETQPTLGGYGGSDTLCKSLEVVSPPGGLFIQEEGVLGAFWSAGSGHGCREEQPLRAAESEWPPNSTPNALAPFL